MAGFMAVPLSGAQLSNLGLSSSSTSGLVANMTTDGVNSSQQSLISQSLNFGALGTNMKTMGMTPAVKSSMSKWNTEYTKLSQKMQSLGINPTQSSSLNGVMGLTTAPNMGAMVSKNHHQAAFSSSMTSTIGKMRKMGKK